MQFKKPSNNIFRYICKDKKIEYCVFIQAINSAVSRAIRQPV